MIEHLKKVHQELGGLSAEVIHISGSKGKGTTAHLLAALLQLSGKTVGLFTSPYLFQAEEMARINGAPIASMEAYLKRVRAQRDDLSEFENLTLASLLAFEEAGCEIVILECGWGGKDDATNIVENKILTILGHVELEHTEVLGKDLESITKAKLGICRPGVPLITEITQLPAVFDIIKTEGHQPILAPQAELGHHHPSSAGMALMAADLLGVAVDAKARAALEKLEIPGRFEVLEWKGHTLVLDGAHTYDSVQYLREKALNYALENRLPEPLWAVHFLSDKNKSMPEMFPLNRSIWMDLEDPRAGHAPEGWRHETVPGFLQRLAGTPASLIIFVGSFRLVAALKAAISR
jgi:dihydrofolate synthase/folylpolyglutamate synthase